MMRFLCLLLLCCATANGLFAQHVCGTAERAIDKPATASDAAIMSKVRQSIQAAASRDADTLIIIPVVVHIVHWNGFGDITDEQVADGIRVLNEDFRRQNADTNLTDSLFKPFAADVNIEFRLASLDPDGNATTGITRSDTNLVPHPEPTEPEFDNVKHFISWPAHKYFNIWVVRTIMAGTSGYAQYPGTDFTYGGPWETYGIVIRHTSFGTIGTANDDGRTLSHEAGHCLGLYHTFLSTSAGCGTECDTTGDEVCDTPPCQLNTSCPPNLNSCSNDSLGPSAYASNIKDQKENYMSYSTCQNMFSQGQKVRMRGFFNAFDTLRMLSSHANLVATGVWHIPADVADENALNEKLALVPNPSAGLVELRGLEYAPAAVRCLDAAGRQVRAQTLAAGTTTINWQLPPGMYLVVVQQETHTQTLRMIVR